MAHLPTHRIQLHNQDIPYVLKRSPKRRSIGLRIDPAGLTVSVPIRLSRQDWENALQQKSAWILSRLEHMRTHATPPFAWETGQMLPFLGSPIELAVEPGSIRIRPVLSEGLLRVTLPASYENLDLKKRVLHWYRSEALVFFQQRVVAYARQLGVEISSLDLSNARTRWGSCTSAGGIRLNWRLIKAPPPVIDYVVAHELAHRIEMNHSPAFWRIVAELCPDYLQLRADLKRHAALYYQF